MNTADRARKLGIKVGDEVEVTTKCKVESIGMNIVETNVGNYACSEIRLIRRAPVTCPDHKAGYICRWDAYRRCRAEACAEIRQPSPPVPPTAEELAEALRVVLGDSRSPYDYSGFGWHKDASHILARWDAAKKAGVCFVSHNCPICGETIEGSSGSTDAAKGKG